MRLDVFGGIFFFDFSCTFVLGSSCLQVALKKFEKVFGHSCCAFAYCVSKDSNNLCYRLASYDDEALLPKYVQLG